MFVFPREPRNVESSVIRECVEKGNGIPTPNGRLGVWLDSPLIDMLQGDGYINKNFPAMHHQFIRYGIDITQEPCWSIRHSTTRTAESRSTTDARPTSRGCMWPEKLPAACTAGIV